MISLRNDSLNLARLAVTGGVAALSSFGQFVARRHSLPAKAPTARSVLRGIALSSCIACTFVNAAEVEVWNGWMNLAPCSKVEWHNNGIFGTPAPTVRTTAQEFHGRILAHIPDGQGLINEVQNDAMQCAAQAAAVTTAAAIVTDGAGGWPAFTSTFYGCMKGRAAGYLVDNLRLETWGHCNW